MNLDPFIGYETDVGTALYAAFLDAKRVMLAEVDEALSEPVNLSFLQEALDNGATRFKNLVTKDLRNEIEASVSEAMASGTVDFLGASAPIASGALSATMVKDASVELVAYYADRYYERFVQPNIEAGIATLQETADPTQPISAAAVKEIVEGGFPVEPEEGSALAAAALLYFLLVANVAVSRAWHYSYLKTAQLNGKRSYKWISVLDAKTSEVCQSMAGREFWIADAVVLMEAVALAGPAAVKTMSPWPKASEVKGVAADALRAMGFLVPPAHARCRSRLIAL